MGKHTKKRKSETKPRDPFNYVILALVKRGEVLLPLSAHDEKKQRIRMWWRMLDCIRRTPDKNFKVPRSRLVLKRPVPAVQGKWAVQSYEFKVDRLFKSLWQGRNLIKEQFPDWYSFIVEYGVKQYKDRENGRWAKSSAFDTCTLAQELRRKKYIARIVWQRVCRMLKRENEDEMLKNPYLTEQQIVQELRKLGCCVPEKRTF